MSPGPLLHALLLALLGAGIRFSVLLKREIAKITDHRKEDDNEYDRPQGIALLFLSHAVSLANLGYIAAERTI